MAQYQSGKAMLPALPRLADFLKTDKSAIDRAVTPRDSDSEWQSLNLSVKETNAADRVPISPSRDNRADLSPGWADSIEALQEEIATLRAEMDMVETHQGKLRSMSSSDLKDAKEEVRYIRLKVRGLTAKLGRRATNEAISARTARPDSLQWEVSGPYARNTGNIQIKRGKPTAASSFSPRRANEVSKSAIQHTMSILPSYKELSESSHFPMPGAFPQSQPKTSQDAGGIAATNMNAANGSGITSNTVSDVHEPPFVFAKVRKWLETVEEEA
ncbi:MAG: hypothetical protein Q9227_008430 [Pyrenula ochraceoflavens]